MNVINDTFMEGVWNNLGFYREINKKIWEHEDVVVELNGNVETFEPVRNSVYYRIWDSVVINVDKVVTDETR